MKKRYDGDQSCLFMPQSGEISQPSPKQTVDIAAICCMR